MRDAEALEKFYSKPFFMSYSGLSRLLYSPRIFYKHYILEEREDKVDSHLINGKLIHCLLLDDGSFDKDFIISPVSVPGDNAKSIIDSIFQLYKVIPEGEIVVREELHEYEKEILDILKTINLHQSLKTDAQRIDKIVDDKAKSYWEFLKIRGNRTIIDVDTLKKASDDVQVLRNNSEVSELLGLTHDPLSTYDVYNELYIQMPYGPFGLKGILDNIKVDHANKKIYINDLKTTGKSITEFPDTVAYYNYWLQAEIYRRLVMDKFKDLLTPDWEIIFHFIVIDIYQQVYCFGVSPQTSAQWYNDFTDKLIEAEWHYVNRKYDLPYSFLIDKRRL